MGGPDGTPRITRPQRSVTAERSIYSGRNTPVPEYKKIRVSGEAEAPGGAGHFLFDLLMLSINEEPQRRVSLTFLSSSAGAAASLWGACSPWRGGGSWGAPVLGKLARTLVCTRKSALNHCSRPVPRGLPLVGGAGAFLEKPDDPSMQVRTWATSPATSSVEDRQAVGCPESHLVNSRNPRAQLVSRILQPDTSSLQNGRKSERRIVLVFKP